MLSSPAKNDATIIIYFLFYSPGMFDGGGGGAAGSGSHTHGSSQQEHRDRRLSRNTSESDGGSHPQGLGGVFGVGVRSNSNVGDEPEEDDVSELGTVGNDAYYRVVSMRV